MIRIVFMGSPIFAQKILQQLVDNKTYHIVAVYSQPPRPKNRGKKHIPTPVHTYSLEQNLTVETPENFNDTQTYNRLQSYKPDLLIVVAYGLILPQSILDIPALGCLNIHPSALPKWRGASPIERSLMNGDTHTAVCIIRMTQLLDQGDIIASCDHIINDNDTAEILYDVLSVKAGLLLLETLPAYIAHSITAVPQSHHHVSYAHKIEKNEGFLDFSAYGAQFLWQKIKALSHHPGCYFFYKEKRIKIYQADYITHYSSHKKAGEFTIDHKHIIIHCLTGHLNIICLQDEAKPKLSTQDYIKRQGWLCQPQHEDT